MESQPSPQDSLENQITKLLGFAPTAVRGSTHKIANHSDSGWLYRGAAAATCPGCNSSSEKHVWELPFTSWAIVCTACGTARTLGEFTDIDDRISLGEAEPGNVEIEPAPLLRVGFFCCGPCPEAVALVSLLNGSSPLHLSGTPNTPNDTHMANYYPLVLEVFKATRTERLSHQTTLCDHLTALRPSLEYLRAKYANDSRSGTVNISYKDQTADAYLLAYVPGTIAQALLALQLAMADASTNLLARLGSPRLRLEIHLFDSQHNEWAATRDSLLSQGCVDRWSGQVCVTQHPFNITDPQSPLQHQEILEQLDLAMFQNFDNEIAQTRAPAEATITTIAELMPSGSQLILSDLYYAMASQKRLRDHWSDLSLGSVQQTSMPSKTIHPNPQRNGPLETCFFSDTQSPRKRLSMNFLVLNRA